MNDVPIGFGMALSMNKEALKTFGALSEVQQNNILAHARGIHSKEEMHRFVSDIANSSALL